LYLKKLKSILKIPDTAYCTGDGTKWSEIEKTLAIQFPEDYKAFINIYGTGRISDFAYI